MYKLCKTEESARRQRQMEQGLLDMMQTVRYEDITVSDLCQKMNIPRKSFYRYFSGKEGALHGLIDHTMMEYEAFSNMHQKGKKRNLQLELETFFQFWVVHRPLLDALQRSGLSGTMIERAVSYSVSDGVFPARFLPKSSKRRPVPVNFSKPAIISFASNPKVCAVAIVPRALERLYCSCSGWFGYYGLLFWS